MKLFLLLFLAIFSACSNGDHSLETINSNQPVDTSSEGAYPIPESLEDIEEQSELIVIAELNEVIQQGELTIPEGRTATISEVTILNILDGDYGEDSLHVSEPYFYNEGTLSLVGNYTPMQRDEEYILFLSNYDGESWMIDYMGFGQYNPRLEYTAVNKHEVSLFEDIQSTDFVSESEEEERLYEIIRNDVLNQYHQSDD